MQRTNGENIAIKDQSNRNRYSFIDAIRGIAACAVLLQHSLQGSNIEVLEKGHFALSWINFGEVGVLAFFLVSGFVIPLSLEKMMGDMRHFWINRAFRIYPLYIFIYCTTLLLTVLWGGQIPNIPKNFLFHILFIHEYVGATNFVGGSWTLSFEAVWYLVFAALYAASLNRKFKVFVPATAALALAACAMSMFHLVRMPMGRIDFLVAFVLGLLCYRRLQGDITKGEFATCALSLLAVIYAGLFVGFQVDPGSNPTAPSVRCVFLSWTLGFLLFFVPYFATRIDYRKVAFVLFLGKISYSIYLIHAVVLLIVGRTSLSGMPFIAVVSVLSIALATISYKFIEEPGIRFSHRLRQRAARVS